MAKLTVLTLSSLIHLVNFDGLYLIGYAWLFGMCEYRFTPSQICLLTEVKLFGSHSLEVCTNYSHLVYYLSDLRYIAGVIAYRTLRKPPVRSSITVVECHSRYSSTTLQCIAAQDISDILRAFDTSVLWSPLLMGSQPSRRSHSHYPAKCR